MSFVHRLVLLAIVVATTTTTTTTTTLAFSFPTTIIPTSFGVSFVSSSTMRKRNANVNDVVVLYSSSNGGGGGGGEEDSKPDPEGADLAAKLFKMAQEKGVRLSQEDLSLNEEDEDEEDDEEDDDEEDDEQEPNIPQGAINAFLGYDTGNVGEKLAGNVSLTDDQLYKEVKERVLDTAGGFVQLTERAPSDDDDDDEDDEDGVGDDNVEGENKPYEPPTVVPDSDLTAGEVVLTVLEALRNNNVPTENKGVEILFGYSSQASQIKQEIGLTPQEYAEFLLETEYKVLFQHEAPVRYREYIE